MISGKVQMRFGKTFLLAVFLFLGVATSLLAAQTAKATTAKPKNVLGAAVDLTLARGLDAVLPPHTSHLLGISPQEQEVPVKQFTEMGEPIRGFDVSTAEPGNVIIFVESRARNERTFYLTSRRGVLRKVLSVREGVGYDRAPTKDDQEAFAKERQHWIERLAPAASHAK